MIKKIYKKVLSPNFRYSEKFLALKNSLVYNDREELMRQIMGFTSMNDIEGDYLEFGVFEGSTFISAYHFAKIKKLKMKFYGFDSFEGLPEIKGLDKGKQFKKGEYNAGIIKVKNILKSKSVDLKKVKLVKGWYDKVLNKETKKKLKIKKAAVIWVDCDLYKSTVPVLDFITEYVQDGTVIAFDDWFCFKGNPEKGEQKAFGEWLEKNPEITATEFHKSGWHGNSFILHKK